MEKEELIPVIKSLIDSGVPVTARNIVKTTNLSLKDVNRCLLVMEESDIIKREREYKFRKDLMCRDPIVIKFSDIIVQAMNDASMYPKPLALYLFCAANKDQNLAKAIFATLVMTNGTNRDGYDEEELKQMYEDIKAFEARLRKEWL